MKHRKSYVKKLHNQAQAKPVRVTTERPRVVNARAFTTEHTESTEKTLVAGGGLKPGRSETCPYERWAVWGMSGMLTLAILAICWR